MPALRVQIPQVRMWLDEKLMLNKTRGDQAFSRFVVHLITGFTFFRIEYDHTERTAAFLRVYYAAKTVPWQVIPSSVLYFAEEVKGFTA